MRVSAAMALAVFFGCVGPLLGAVEPAAADSNDQAQELVDRFAPVLMIKKQAHPCDEDGEAFLPMPVDIVLDNPEVALRMLSSDDPVMKWAPRAADVSTLGEGFFLDLPGNSLTPGCLYERLAKKFQEGVSPTIYAHIVKDPTEPSALFVQYWFFWLYNDWNNKHEGDWEGITLKFNTTSVEGALESEPVEAGYAQHEGGERASWDDPKLSKQGTRPIVYSSAGSHASYFGSALHLGRGASEGFGCDNTDGPSAKVDPKVIVLPDQVQDPDGPLAWVSFQGRWGESQDGAFNAPTGPGTKARWDQPAKWFNGLRGSSVVVPVGDTVATSVMSAFCASVEGGSAVLTTTLASPGYMALAAIGLVLVAQFIAGRTDWSKVPVQPLIRPRRIGQVLRGAFRTYSDSALVFGLFGLIYIPAAVIATGALGLVVRMIPFFEALEGVATEASVVRIALAVLVGGVGSYAAFTLTNALVVSYLGGGENGRTGAMAAIHDVWDHRAPLASAFVRSFATLIVLFATIVGIPWALRQLVRYQFCPHVVMLEGCRGREALTRSSRLTVGRWWRTAAFVVVVDLMMGAISLVASLLLLMLTTTLPLWLFSALVVLIGALVVPLAASAMSLYYGDAAAAQGAD